MNTRRRRGVLSVYFFADHLLCGFLLFPLLKASMANEAFHACALLIHLVILTVCVAVSAGSLWKQTGGNRSAFFSKCMRAAALIIGTQLFCSYFLQKAGIESANQQAVSLMRNESVFRYVFETLLYAPVMEEIVFRECLYDELKTLMPERFSAFLSCILFGLIHTGASLFSAGHSGLLYLPVYALCALVLLKLKQNTGSIQSSMLAHACVNLAVLVISYG